MVKIAQKISGGFRGTEGADAFLALRRCLSTAAKQGMNRLEVCGDCSTGTHDCRQHPTPTP
jgi:hypothetical protein